jgi:putative spermidine/putrescine transport system permease protein
MPRRFYDAGLAVALTGSLVLFLVPQFFFIHESLYKNLGMGETGELIGLANYRQLLTDPFTLGVFARTLALSAVATLVALVLAAPTAYWLVRLRSRLLGALVILLLVSSFVSVVVKALGLQMLLGSNGLIVALLRWLTMDGWEPRLLYNDFGVAIGLVQYILPLMVVLLFGVVQNIPVALEEAALVHGASDWRMFRRVLIPEAMRGLLVSSLIAFNMNMGAFTSAVLLGGGKVLTVPVLIQRKITLDLDYPNAAALAVLLTLAVVAINLLAGRLGLRKRTQPSAMER